MLVGLVSSLLRVSPRCGETTIQKAAFIGQVLLELPFEMEWRLYKHGPYSQDVRDELDRCEKAGRLRIHRDVGRSIRYETRPVPATLRLSSGTEAKLELLSRRLAPMRLSQLETIATAAWATRFSGGDLSLKSRSRYVHKLKPHIDESRAARALEYLDSLISDVAALPPAPRLKVPAGARRSDAGRSTQDAPYVVLARSGIFRRRLYFVRDQTKRGSAPFAELVRAADSGRADASMLDLVRGLELELAAYGYRRIGR